MEQPEAICSEPRKKYMCNHPCCPQSNSDDWTEGLISTVVIVVGSIIGMLLVLHLLLPLIMASVRHSKGGKVSTVSSFAATNATSTTNGAVNGVAVNGSEKSESTLEASLSGNTSVQRSRSSKLMTVLRDALGSQTSNDKSVHRCVSSVGYCCPDEQKICLCFACM